MLEHDLFRKPVPTFRDHALNDLPRHECDHRDDQPSPARGAQPAQQSLTEGVAVGITAIALFEMWYGIQKSPRPPENAAALGLFLTLDVTPWPFEPSDAEEAGDIRAALERAGTRIGPTMSSSPPRRAAAAPSW